MKCVKGALKNENKKLISCVLACGWPPNKGYKWNDTLSLMKYGENYNYKEIVDIQNDFVKYDVRNGVEKPVAELIDSTMEYLGTIRKMSKRSYENHALLYYFSSFARSKTSSYSCGLYVFHMGAVRPAIVGYTAPIWKTRFCL